MLNKASYSIKEETLLYAQGGQPFFGQPPTS